jgi:hypothetical protein
MERLLTMDKEQFISEMQVEVRGILERVADAVNNAPTGKVINGSEIAVREAMAELRQQAGVHRQCREGLAAGAWRRDAVHRAGLPVGERVQ